MLTIPINCEFRSISRQNIKFEKDGKPQDFERVNLACESIPDGAPFQASPGYGVVLPSWVTPDLRGKKITLLVNDLRTEKGNTAVRFSECQLLK